MKFIVLKDSELEKKATKGTFVYLLMRSDYGLSRDDTETTGIEHISVTLNEDGDYPSFTIPRNHLERVN